MKTENENCITSRILRICAGNPGSIRVFAQVMNEKDEATLKKIVERAEEEEWKSSTAWEIYKASDKNIELFTERFS